MGRLCNICLRNSTLSYIGIITAPTGNAICEHHNNTVARFTLRDRIALEDTISHLKPKVCERTAVSSKHSNRIADIFDTCGVVHILKRVLVLPLRRSAVRVLVFAHEHFRVFIIVILSTIPLPARKADDRDPMVDVVIARFEIAVFASRLFCDGIRKASNSRLQRQ